jgi:hypothetical protein
MCVYVQMVVVNVPGRVIADSIEYSRQWAHADPPMEKGGFIQVGGCDIDRDIDIDRDR